MKKSPNPFIYHIIDACTQIQKYIDGQSRSKFDQDRLIQDAVVRQLEIIGEACAKLETKFKISHSHIPWREIVAMRNKLTHEYWNIDLDLVWRTATHEIPPLKAQLLDLINQLEQ